MCKITIDTKFDFSKDTKCGDPDKDSLKLYEYQKLLWSKELPCGKYLELNIICNNYGQLLLNNNLYGDFSSDRLFPHLVGKYNNRFDDWLNDIEKNELKYYVQTIGGHIIFPAHENNGQTINQLRFFSLFVNFEGYINFFLLQDLIDDNGNINFILPFDNFNRSPLLESIVEYKLYKNKIFDLVNKRNERISNI